MRGVSFCHKDLHASLRQQEIYISENISKFPLNQGNMKRLIHHTLSLFRRQTPLCSANTSISDRGQREEYR